MPTFNQEPRTRWLIETTSTARLALSTPSISYSINEAQLAPSHTQGTSWPGPKTVDGLQTQRPHRHLMMQDIGELSYVITGSSCSVAEWMEQWSGNKLPSLLITRQGWMQESIIGFPVELLVLCGHWTLQSLTCLATVSPWKSMLHRSSTVLLNLRLHLPPPWFS